MSLTGIVGRTGGKSKLKKRIRAMMPPHTTYIEPFVGGGSVFFAAPADPNVKEVINDKDKDIMNIYIDMKKVGDKIDGFTPPSKERFKQLQNQKTFSSPTERLRRNLLISRYSFRSDRKSYAPSTIERDGGPQFLRKKYYKYKDRLKNTRILNQDYKSVIRKYDSPTAFIYLDPPYSTAGVHKDYNDNDVKIEDIINTLKTVKGKFILSYDNVPIAKRLARAAGFKVMMATTTYTDGGGGKIPKKELLIRNY